MSPKDTGTPKEGRFSQAKNLKKDLILETRDLLHKLELIYREMRRMPQEEREKFWPQASTTIAYKNVQKAEKEMLIALLTNAQISIQTSELFKKYDIDLSNERTRQLIQQQAQAQTIGH
jgi:hypothetical protein